MNRKYRVIIGPSVIAGVSYELSKALRSVGVKSDSFTWKSQKEYMGYKFDKIFYTFPGTPPFYLFKKNPFYFINLFLKFIYLLFSMLKYNVYIFIKPITFLPNNIDIKLLKFFKKKIVFIFSGCMEKDPNFGLNQPDFECNHCKHEKKKKSSNCYNLEKKREDVQEFEKMADYIISNKDCGNFLTKKENMIYFLAATSESDNIDPFKKYEVEEITIVHLPSDMLAKQTNVIEPILKRIESEYQVRTIIKKDYWEREKLLQTLETSHILVESLGGITYGVLGVEAMARGCVVMSSYPEWISENYDYHAVVKVTADNLYSTLCKYIENRKLLIDQAQKSIEFYKRYHSYEAVGNYYRIKLDL